jgi:coproporphyrinogen III oxidase-like Fe-S oxidoreductase
MRPAGFDNINIDLMFALPGQTPAQWRPRVAERVRVRV